MTTIDRLGRDELQQLEHRAQTVCVTYPDHPMPPGCEPARARIGVETSDDDDDGEASREGKATLFVDRGVEYVGARDDVRTWLVAGQRSFPDLDALVEWVRGWTSAVSSALRRPEPRSARQLVDVDAVDLSRPAHDPQTMLDHLTTRLRLDVIGQDAAVHELTQDVAAHVGKLFPRRPLSLLMLGPTGVGKTQAAESLAAALREIDPEWKYLRLDMAEQSSSFSTSRLVGAPPGYVGYRDASLASRLAEHPRQLVLFDEIEKAHEQVTMTLMNLMDAGRLDSAGHGEVNASQSVLLFTSNLGVRDLPTVNAPEEMDSAGRSHLLEHGMAPELVGRFRRILVFTPLTASAQVEIAAKSVAVVAADYGCEVEAIDPAYLSGLLRDASAQRLGVRVLEHRIDADLGHELAVAGSRRVIISATPPRVQPVPRVETDDELPEASTSA